MVTTRTTPRTLTQIIADVRLWLNDRDTDPQGNTIESPRFSNGNIIDAINFQLSDMYNDAQIEHMGESLVSMDLTYTGATGMDLTADEIEADAAIVFVEDIGQEPSRPRRIRYVAPMEISAYENNVTNNGANTPPSVYTLMASRSESAFPRIKVAPVGDSRSLRIWYVAAPYMTDATGANELPFTTRFREYIGVGAACRLLVHGDITEHMAARLVRCEAQFQRFCAHMADNDSIRTEFPR